MLCLYVVTRCKQSYSTKSDQPAVVQLSVPVYEDVHALPQPSGNNKQTIELKENVAYGPI